ATGHRCLTGTGETDSLRVGLMLQMSGRGAKPLAANTRPGPPSLRGPGVRARDRLLVLHTLPVAGDGEVILDVRGFRVQELRPLELTDRLVDVAAVLRPGE